MFITTPTEGYSFNQVEVKQLEVRHDCKYIGYWTVQDINNGGWKSNPVDVFYKEVPDADSLNTKYIGYFKKNGEVRMIDAQSAFSVTMTGIVCADGEILVSRYRTHRASKGDKFIEGGRDFIQYGGNNNKFVDITIYNGQFSFLDKQNV